MRIKLYKNTSSLSSPLVRISLLRLTGAARTCPSTVISARTRRDVFYALKIPQRSECKWCVCVVPFEFVIPHSRTYYI